MATDVAVVHNALSGFYINDKKEVVNAFSAEWLRVFNYVYLFLKVLHSSDGIVLLKMLRSIREFGKSRK